MILGSLNLNIKIKTTISISLINFLSIIFLFGCVETFYEKIEKPKIVSNEKLYLVNLEPKNMATSVKRNSKIILQFSISLNSSTISVNTENTMCSGTIQITINNFKTCVIMNLFDLMDKNKKIILTPKGAYAANHYHKIRLTKEIKSKNGASLKSDFITTPGFRTTWSQQIGTRGDDTGFAVSVDKEENIYVTGLTNANESNDQKDIFIAKYLPSGFQLWIKQPGFGRSVMEADLQTKNNGDIVLSAYSKGQRSSDIILVSYDVHGEKKFSKIITQIGISQGEGITMDKEGHIYVTAATPFNILKIGRKGKKIWGSELNHRLKIRALAVDKENGLYAAGNIKNSLKGKNKKVGNEIFLLKISKMGPKLWRKTYRSKRETIINSIAIHSDKNVAIVGYIKRSGNIENKKQTTIDAFTEKYNSEGKLQWQHILSSAKSEQNTFAHWTPEGNLIVGGFTESNLEENSHMGKEDAFVAKYNNDGQLLWLKQFGTMENERPSGIALGRKGEIYLTGFSEGEMDGAKYYGGRDIFLVKYDKDGKKL